MGAIATRLNSIATEIRKRMDRGKFRCLSSLLNEIGQGLLADEIGLLVDDPTEQYVKPRRQIRINSDALIKIPPDILTMKVRGAPSQSRKVHSDNRVERCATYY